VGCGYDGNALKDIWRYDPAKDLWEQVTSLPGSKREGASAFVIGKTVYVVAGQNNDVDVYDFWAYDPVADSWTEKRKIADITPDTFDDEYNIARSYAASFVMNGKAYLALGGNRTSPRGDVWEYDPAVDLWTQRSDFEANARLKPIGFAVDNRGFAGLGGNAYDDILEFHPTEKFEEYD
jgi:N-acetylneuraminic acid mutarotase